MIHCQQYSLYNHKPVAMPIQSPLRHGAACSCGTTLGSPSQPQASTDQTQAGSNSGIWPSPVRRHGSWHHCPKARDPRHHQRSLERRLKEPGTLASGASRACMAPHQVLALCLSSCETITRGSTRDLRLRISAGGALESVVSQASQVTLRNTKL